MTNDIKQKIEQIKNGEIPEGYRYSRAGLCPNDWRKGVLSDVLYNELRVVPKPQKSYWRIGIRSHAKGTFHEYVENPETIDMDELYVVKENDLILNITFAWELAVALADKNDDGLLVSHRFPTYVFREGQNPIFYKNVVVQERFKQMLVLISPGGAGRNRVMSKKDFLKLPCNIPPCEEQQKIAEILIQCDKLIKLYQSEIDELQKLKNTCLRKMFPEKGKNVPEWRFPQFTDAWEQRKLGDIFEEYSEKNHEELPVLMIVQGGGTIQREESDRRLLYDKANLSNYKMVREGDFIVHLRSFEGGLEKATNTGIISPAYHTFHGENTDSRFYYSYFRSKKFIGTDLKPHVYGIRDGRSIDIDGMKTIKIPYTSYEEQTAIGTYIEQFDHLITLHQRKLEEMKKQKKALMQLLLTGIVRA